MVKGSNDYSLYILSVSTPLPAFVDFSDYKNSSKGFLSFTAKFSSLSNLLLPIRCQVLPSGSSRFQGFQSLNAALGVGVGR